MRYLRTNTAARVTVGPFFDKTDGITPETALTVTSEKLTFVVDDGNVPTLVLDVAPTASGGSNDMVHITGDDAGFYDLELAAANVNYLGRAILSLTDAATHCPVFHEFMILPAMIYDAMVLGTDVLQVDVTQLLGTAWLTPGTAGTPDVNAKLVSASATAADNLETAALAYSATRGLAGTALPAAAADAAGGLPISDAGGLDLDARLDQAVSAAKTLTTGERTSIADALLDRDMATGTDSGSATVRTVRQALRSLRNAWAIVAGTRTVTKEDDTTESWHEVLTGTAGADPVTSTEPEGP